MRCETNCIIGYDDSVNKVFITVDNYAKMNEEEKDAVELFNFCPYCGSSIEDLLEEKNEETDEDA